eukprot:CAMPEP_0168344110 /NCGR_PEP_ID=MMETSP0213-20121227/16594_1 /TAXON_ID=151035 /ORGANISM="Euplotes harpa, Strain FSP1.4" /LENGTH=79 /DNA_ID=CAMNT_0008351735 /DNA_START=12 /DNA_END=247 /DNA_ORIENTATION=+
MYSKLMRTDEKWSQMIHSMDAKHFEVVLLVAGVLFSPFGAAVFPFIIYLLSLLYFREDPSVTSGSDLFWKAVGHALVYT